MTRINPCCHITAFIPFLLVAGEQEPAAVCAWSSTKIEISLVFISQSSRHLFSPPLFPSSSTLFFSSFFKWRTVMVCIEVVWEAGNGGGGGEKVIGCTIASHTAFNCFSPTHSRKWKVRSAGQYVLMYVLLYALWKIGLWCRFYSPLFVSDTFFAQKNTTKKIHHPKPALFSLARRQGSSPYRALPERWGKTTKNWN